MGSTNSGYAQLLMPESASHDDDDGRAAVTQTEVRVRTYSYPGYPWVCTYPSPAARSRVSQVWAGHAAIGAWW